MTASAVPGDGQQALPLAPGPAAIPGVAEASIRAAIAQLEALLPERALTVRELWERYLSSLPAERWVISVKSTMVPFLAACADVQVAALSPSHWSDFVDAPGAPGTPSTRERYSVGTRNAMLYRLKSCLNWAVATDRIPYNPLARAKVEKAPPERETIISTDGEAAMLSELDPLMRAFFLLALDGAMRRDEIRLLEWADIDEVAMTVTLPANRTKGRTRRVVKLTSRALEAVLALPRLAVHVFVNPKTGRPYDATAIWKRWRKARNACGIVPASGESPVRIHDARRSAATRLTSLGAKVTAVQRILGHKRHSTTSLYIRVDSQDVIDAYKMLETSTRKPPRRAGARKVGAEKRKATGS